MTLKYIERTPEFKKDFKRALHKHRDPLLLREAINAIFENQKVVLKHLRDHKLQGAWMGYRELHIQADWLLIYKIDKGTLTLVLTATGSHDELFG